MNLSKRKLCQLANFIIPVYLHIQMLTNKAVYDFIPSYSGLGSKRMLCSTFVVEINVVVHPSCPCSEDVSCGWADTDYINYACMCDGLCVSAKELRDDPALCGKIRNTCKYPCRPT